MGNLREASVMGICGCFFPRDSSFQPASRTVEAFVFFNVSKGSPKRLFYNLFSSEPLSNFTRNEKFCEHRRLLRVFGTKLMKIYGTDENVGLYRQ